MAAGSVLGPVISITHTTRTELADGRSKAGYVTAGFRNPLRRVVLPESQNTDGQPKIVYVNVWCTDNNAGHESGVSFCEIEWRAKESKGTSLSGSDLQQLLA